MAQSKPLTDLENLSATIKGHVPRQLGRVIGYGLALRAIAARPPRRAGKPKG